MMMSLIFKSIRFLLIPLNHIDYTDEVNLYYVRSCLFVILNCIKQSIFSKRYGLYRHKQFLKQARLAQSVERQALNLVVEGSSPSVGDSFLFFQLLLDFH